MAPIAGDLFFMGGTELFGFDGVGELGFVDFHISTD